MEKGKEEFLSTVLKLENTVGHIYRRVDLYAKRISYYYKANAIRKKMS